MRSKRLAIVWIVPLLLLLAYGCGGTSNRGNGNVGGAQSTILVVNSTLEAIKIEADLPPMQVNHQVYITVSLYPTGRSGRVSEVPAVKDATAVVTNATPVGTPGTTLVNAFGPDRSADATATLETSPDIFSVSPTTPQTKPLDLPKVEWSWFVTPLVAGPQSIGVDIEAQWTSMINGKQSLPYTLGFPKFPVNVQANVIAPTPTPPPTPFEIMNAILSPLATVAGAIIAGIFSIIVALIALYGTSRDFRRRVNSRLARSKRGSSSSNEKPAD